MIKKEEKKSKHVHSYRPSLFKLKSVLITDHGFEHLKVYISTFDLILFILAGIKDLHISLVEYGFWPERTSN